LRAGFPISIVLHSSVVALGVFVLPTSMPDRLNETPIIPIELVTLAETTDIKAAIPVQKPEPEPVIEQQLAPEPPVVISPPIEPP